ncbi:MAG: hypothetical protein K6T83_12130, partial [Alicyclobacillus sp.]|nr:hypothetical protein [Alicyclobacillus sp.]
MASRKHAGRDAGRGLGGTRFGGWGSGDRSHTRRRHRLAVSLFGLLLLCYAVYFIFFRIHDVGPRTITVNGENVEQVDGFLVRSTVWLSKPQVHRFLERIEIRGAALPRATRMYHGVPYIRAVDVAALLTRYGDRSAVVNGLAVTLRPNQHYRYNLNGDFIQQRQVLVNGHPAGWVLVVEHDEAMYVGADRLAHVLSNAGRPVTWHRHVLNLAAAAPSSPAPIGDPSAYTTIAFGAGKSMYAPTYVWQGSDYVPVYSVCTALAQTGWMPKVGSWTWSLTSHTKAAGGQVNGASTTFAGGSPPTALAFVPFYFGDLAAFEDVMHHQRAFTALAEDVWSVDADGSLSGGVPAGAASEAAASGDAVYAMVTNLVDERFDANLMSKVLGDPARSTRLRNDIVRLVRDEGYDGATLDFESIAPADSKEYT